MLLSMPLIGYVLKAAIRDRMVVSLICLLALGSALSIFLGSSAVIEQDIFSVVFAAGGLRIAGVLGLTLFVVFFIRRSFDGKDLEFLLSRPIGRIQLILSYATAFSILALVVSLAIGCAVWGVAPHLFSQGHILWIVSVAVENVVMANTAFFFAMYISSAAGASMAAFAFYILSRMMGQLLGIIDSPLVDSSGPAAMAVQLVSMIMPRFDLLGQTSWLLYGADSAYGLAYICAQGGMFCFLVLLAAMLDFVTRQF